MGVTLKYEEKTYRRKAVYTLPPDVDQPIERHPEHPAIKPSAVSVELDRDGEQRPWGIAWASLNGIRILKNGSEGLQFARHQYSASELHHAPAWVQSLANGYLIVCELERQGRKLRPADIRDNPEYFISGPGVALAAATSCDHGYLLTSTCPGCDYDEDHGAAPYGHCEANARKGTGTGMCERPLDMFGFCDRPSNHTD